MTVNTLGSDSRLGGGSAAPSKSRDSRTVAEWLWPFLAQGVALFSISALFYCHFHRQGLEPGSLLQHAVIGLYDVFGLAPSVVFFLMVFAWASIWLFTGILERPMVRVTKLLVMVLMLGVFFNLGSGGVAADTHTGSLGAWIAGRLVVGIGYVPSIVLVWPTMFASVMLATDWFFTEWFERDRTTTNFEVGVEDAVTDHLRGLSSVANAPESAERPATLEATAAAVAVAITKPVEQSGAAEAPVVIEPVAAPAEVAVEEGVVASEPVRDDLGESSSDGGDYIVPARPMSYAERRRQRAERRSVEDAEADSVPETPVSAAEPAAAEPVSQMETGSGEGASVGGTPLVGKEELAALFGTVHESDVADEPVVAEAVAEESEVNEEEVVAEGDADDESEGVDYEDEAAEAELEDEVDEEELEGEDVDEEDLDDEEHEDEDEDEDEYEDEDEDEDDEYEEVDDDEEVDDEELDDEELEEEEGEDEDEDDEYEYVEVEEGEEEEGDEEEVDEEESADEVYVQVADQDGEEAGGVASEDAEEAREVAETVEADGSVVSIPRPDEAPPVVLPTPPVVAEERESSATKQQRLFGGGVDEDLLLEAIDVVNSGRRTTATLLQRKLRIEYELAVEVLDELTSRGLLSGDEDRS